MLYRAKQADWCISGMTNGDTCAELHFLTDEWNANPEFTLAFIDRDRMQLMLVLLTHPLLPQMLCAHLLPLRNGGVSAAMDSGNVAVIPYLICV